MFFLDLGGVFFCHGFEGMLYVIDLGLFFIRLCLWFKDFVFSWCASVPPCFFQLFNLFTFPALRSNSCTPNLELSAVFYLIYSTYEDIYLPEFSDGVLEVFQLHLHFSLSSSQYSYLLLNMFSNPGLSSSFHFCFVVVIFFGTIQVFIVITSFLALLSTSPLNP